MGGEEGRETAGGAGSWDPAQYNRFAAQRGQPFFDLCQLLEPVAAPVATDLGCGDGRLTAVLHQRLGGSTTGLDSSPAMLERARLLAGPGLHFVEGDLTTWHGNGQDLVLSNAALHWAPDHPAVLARWASALVPGGQMAVQMPANADHASHVVARALGREWLGEGAPPDPVEANVLAPERYAELFFDLGFRRQQVRLVVYGHLLESTEAVVEWVKGTSLTRFRAVLPAEDYEQFLAEYRRRLVAVLGDVRPYFYAFKRILLWGRRRG